MKTEDLVLVGGLAIGGYLLFKMMGNQSSDSSGPGVWPVNLGPTNGSNQGNNYVGPAIYVGNKSTGAVFLQHPTEVNTNIRSMGYLERHGVATVRVGSTTRIVGTSVGVIGKSASTSLNPLYQPGLLAQTRYGMGR